MHSEKKNESNFATYMDDISVTDKSQITCLVCSWKLDDIGEYSIPDVNESIQEVFVCVRLEKILYPFALKLLCVDICDWSAAK